MKLGGYAKCNKYLFEFQILWYAFLGFVELFGICKSIHVVFLLRLSLIKNKQKQKQKQSNNKVRKLKGMFGSVV